MNPPTPASLPPADAPAPSRSRILISRLLVIGLFGWIFLFGAAAFWLSLRPREGAERRMSPFAEWDGTWEGEVQGFDADGRRVTHLRLRQEFRHVPSDDQFRQEMHVQVTDLATGATKEEKALNSADFDGTRLRRKTYKEKGSVVELREGVRDGATIVWTREVPGGMETLRERIEGDSYIVEGEGFGGEAPTVMRITFRGQFHRVE